MHIDTQGSGPDLVLIHGWAMHSGIFRPLLERLADRYTLHCVDLPGHGRSPQREGPLDLTDTARRIAEAVPPATWLGWSMGGLVALNAALTQSWHVRGLAMLAASPRFVVGADWPHGVEHAVFEQFGRELAADYRGTLERFLALEVHGSDCARTELRELRAQLFARGEPALHVLEDGLRILADSDLRGSLGQIGVPSLWLAGARDRLIPWQALEWAAAQQSNARFIRITGGGHAPFIGHPDAVVAQLDRLLREVHS